MPYGAEFYNASGQLTAEYSTRYGRVLGILSGLAASGNFEDAGFAQGTPWAASITNDERVGVIWPYSIDDYERGTITFAGNVMTWANLAPSARRIVYGVY
jgi:hypothetical protein